jgi:hypothetical protein
MARCRGVRRCARAIPRLRAGNDGNQLACDAYTAAIKGASPPIGNVKGFWKDDYAVKTEGGNRVAVNAANAIVVGLSRTTPSHDSFIAAGTRRFRATNLRCRAPNKNKNGVATCH